MRVIIEIQSYVLVDVPDCTESAEDPFENLPEQIGFKLCENVLNAIYHTPVIGNETHVLIDTYHDVWNDTALPWLDKELVDHASLALDVMSTNRGSE